MRAHRHPTFSLLLFAVLVVFASCDDTTKPPLPPTSGTVTLKTPGLEGFIFSRARTVSHSKNPQLLPDLVLVRVVDMIATPLGVCFDGLPWEWNTGTTFLLVGYPETTDSARALFEGFLEVPVDAEFAPFPDLLRQNQVWAVCTRDSAFAKLLIREAWAVGDTLSSYGEATFDWVFQPNGSRLFPR